MSAIVDRRYDTGIVGSLDGQRGAAVKGFRSGQNALAAGMERGELESVLIGLGTGIDQKQPIVLITAGAAQTFGQLLLKAVHHRIGIKAQLRELMLQRTDIMRVTMTYADNGMATVKIKVFLSGTVPDMASLPFGYLNIKKGVYGIKFHLLVFFYELAGRSRQCGARLFRKPPA